MIPLLILVFCCVTSCVLAQATPEQGQSSQGRAKPAKPNVLLVISDDMGYGDLGCYGSRQIPTPALDTFAAQGVRTTHGYVTAPVCAPSRAGLITGRMQNRFGFDHNLAYPKHVAVEHVGLPVRETTMGQRMKRLGYRTALIGKWHLGKSPAQHPNKRGFDRFFGMINGNHHYFPTLEKHHLERDGKPIEKVRTPYLTDWFTDEAIDFVQEEHGGRPWLLYLSYNTPHTPLQAKKEDLEHFAHVAPKKRRIYCAMQRNLDHNFGRLMRALDASGQAENTLVVFVNDNGGSCNASFAVNAPLRGQKGIFLEGGLRVPMIFRWPAGGLTPSVYEHPVSTVDFVSTFVAAAGGKWKKEYIGRGRKKKERIYDGVNLLPYLRGERGKERPHQDLFWRISARGAAVRSGDMKLVRVPFAAPMLYDLARDPSELRDLAGERPDEVARLMKKLHLWECSHESNPLWMSGVYWASYNRKLYARKYVLDQAALSK